MREKKSDSIDGTTIVYNVHIGPNGRKELRLPGAPEPKLYTLVHLDGREELYPPAAANLAKIDAPSREAIARHIVEDPDVGQTGTEEMAAKATLHIGDKLVARRGRPRSAAPKKPVSVRLDPDVIEGFRAGGAGWQSRMNAALRAHLMGARRAGNGQAVRAKPAKTAEDGQALRKKLAKRSSVSHLPVAAKPAKRR
jgi:uncharacterized protein (DUF4415 family)